MDRLDGIAIAKAIGEALEASAFFHAQAVFLAVGFEGTVPLAQKDLSILDGPKEGQGAVVVARCTATKAATEIAAVARSVADGLTATGAAIDNGAAPAGDVVEENRWATADAGDDVATHATAIRLLVVKRHPCVVRHASFLGAAQARENRPVGFNTILIGADVGSLASLLRDEASTTDVTARSKVLEFGFGNQAFTFGWPQVEGSTKDLPVSVGAFC